MCLMLSGTSDRMFDTPASRLSVTNEKHSDTTCLIERWVFLLHQI